METIKIDINGNIPLGKCYLLGYVKMKKVQEGLYTATWRGTENYITSNGNPIHSFTSPAQGRQWVSENYSQIDRY